MSVMLTCTKNALRKKSARKVKSAGKRKPEAKPKAAGNPSVAAHNIKMWNWSVLDGEEESVVTLTFRKDTMEIWINDEVAKIEESFAVDSEGAVVNFDSSQQKGTISTCRNELGELEQVLTLDTPDGPVIVE